MTEAETAYKSAVAAHEAAQRKLGGIPRTEVEARAVALREMKQTETAVREAKEALKVENMKRNFAGIGSPLHVACVERCPGLVPELEQRAIEIQTERDRAGAERRAKKEAAAAPVSVVPPKRQTSTPEVIVRRPLANGNGGGT